MSLDRNYIKGEEAMEYLPILYVAAVVLAYEYFYGGMR